MRCIIAIIVVVAACKTPPAMNEATVLDAERAPFSALSPETFPSAPPDVTNAWADDENAAALGQKLFFTTVFSGRLLDGDNTGLTGTLGTKHETGKVACASCHQPENGFSDRRSPSGQISLGSGWGLRRAPSLLDVGHATLVTWDGGRDTLFNQVFGALESPVEMNTSRLFTAQQIFTHFKDEYEAVFGALPPLDDHLRFPPLSANVTGCQPSGNAVRAVCDGPVHGSPGDGAEYDQLSATDKDAVTRVVANLGKAIGAYERKLSCGPGRFDEWMRGNDGAMTDEEKRGALIFIGKGQCVGCHSGPLFSDQRMHNIGLRPRLVAGVFIDNDDRGAAVGIKAIMHSPLNSKGALSDGDDGRLPSEVDPSWEGAFRTPTLRCVSQRPAFFHTGHVLSLDNVVEHFNSGGDSMGFPGKSEIAPLDLTKAEKAALVAFLRTLDGPGPDAALMKAR
jgi:cytochrome c peroxidase